MRPAFRLLAGDRDITAAIADRLLSLTFVDEAEEKSDRLTVRLDDRPRLNGARAALPSIGAGLTLFLGYDETGLVEMGRFTVDEIAYSGPPDALEVKASAADFTGPFRAPASREWHDTTLGSILETLAGEHGYVPAMDAALAAIRIPHASQTAESPMAFLTRLARGHDAVAKPVAGRLVLAPKGAAKAVSGKDLPPARIALADMASWSVQYSARKEAGQAATDPDAPATGGARAYWYDYEAGERREVTSGRAPFEEIRHIHRTRAEALAAVSTKAKSAGRDKTSLSFTCTGRPTLWAEQALSVTGMRQGLPTQWRIVTVTHAQAGSGYSCQVKAEQFHPGQPSTAAGLPEEAGDDEP